MFSVFIPAPPDRASFLARLKWEGYSIYLLTLAVSRLPFSHATVRRRVSAFRRLSFMRPVAVRLMFGIKHGRRITSLFSMFYACFIESILLSRLQQQVVS